MIVAIGVPGDRTFSHFIRRAGEFGKNVVAIDLSVAVDGGWEIVLPEGRCILEYEGARLELSAAASFYCRMVDLSAHDADARRALRWRALTHALSAFLEQAPGLVVNRPDRAAHNRSKPLHEGMLRKLGLNVPETITSSDGAALRAFVCEGETISKTVCGTRADAVAVTEHDFAGFHAEQGPVHLQRLIRGTDVRIHVVGGRYVAQRVSSANVDYRADGSVERMEVYVPPTWLGEKVVAATNQLDLAFAGWDFKVDATGNYWCLEVNPMPGYHPYDLRCEGAISRLLLEYMAPAASASPI